MLQLSDYLRRVKQLVNNSRGRLRDERRTNGTFGIRRLLSRRLPGILSRLPNPFAAADKLAANGRLDDAVTFYQKRLGPVDQARPASMRRSRFQWAALGDLLTANGQLAEADRIYNRVLGVAPGFCRHNGEPPT